MGQIGISITMRTVFRDSTQEFGNTFHYGSLETNPNAGEAEQLIDELVGILKPLHSTAVEFVYARCWSSGGGQAANQMIFEKPLTGTGGAALVTGMDKERAFLIQWDAGIDNRGHKVKLRKWFHTCGQFGAIFAPNSDHLANTTAISQVNRDAIASAADAVTRIGGIEEWGLIAESGRERDGGPPVAHSYLEHRQLGDQWRG